MTKPIAKIDHLISGQHLVLDVRKSMFWKETQSLVISDLHLGKAGHFRKHGIPIPTTIHQSDLQVVSDLITAYNPRSLIFLGDLFHSEYNEEWGAFGEWLSQYLHLEVILILGNHDVLDKHTYANTHLTIVSELILPPFHFTHERRDSEYYNISGHIHPSIRLKGAARQSISLPCFYFQEHSALLPAFGDFTGNYQIRAQQGSRVFALGEDEIIALIG